jgi:hypothetical protein
MSGNPKPARTEGLKCERVWEEPRSHVSPTHNCTLYNDYDYPFDFSQFVLQPSLLVRTYFPQIHK